MIMKFHELTIGAKFTIDNIEYIRIADERISCCKVLNAQKTENNEKVQIVPITDVNVVNNNS
jgi:hypothetical protein